MIYFDYMDELENWIWEKENSLETLTKNMFLENFQQNFMNKKGVTKIDMVRWAQDFRTFLDDNRTFEVDPERTILMNHYLKD